MYNSFDTESKIKKLTFLQKYPKKLTTFLFIFSSIIMILMLTLPESVNKESDFAGIKVRRVILTKIIFIIFFIVCYLLIQNTMLNGKNFDSSSRTNRFTKLFGPIVLTLYCFKFFLFTYIFERQGGMITQTKNKIPEIQFSLSYTYLLNAIGSKQPRNIEMASDDMRPVLLINRQIKI